MNPAPGVPGFLQAFEQDGIPEKRAIINGLGDPGQILIDNTARPDIEMPHFRVSHLSLGKTDRQPRRLQFRKGIIPAKPSHNRRICQRYGIVFLAWAETPAVKNHQNQRFRHCSSSRMTVSENSRKLTVMKCADRTEGQTASNSSVMVGLTIQNGKPTVNLFQEKDPHHLMGKRHTR